MWNLIASVLNDVIELKDAPLYFIVVGGFVSCGWIGLQIIRMLVKQNESLQSQLADLESRNSAARMADRAEDERRRHDHTNRVTIAMADLQQTQIRIEDYIIRHGG